MQVLITRATRRCSTSTTSHSTRPIVRPVFTVRAVATRRPLQNGRRKLIFSSRVVKLSPSPSVEAYAVPIAASATSQMIPPWSVPMGLACCGPASSSKIAFPVSIEVGRKPTSLPTGAPGPSPRTIALKRSISLATTPPSRPDGNTPVAQRARSVSNRPLHRQRRGRRELGTDAHQRAKTCVEPGVVLTERDRRGVEVGRARLGQPQQLFADRVVITDDGDLGRA